MNGFTSDQVQTVQNQLTAKINLQISELQNQEEQLRIKYLLLIQSL